MASWEKNSVSIWPSWQENKLFTVLLGILMVYGIVWMGVSIKTGLLESRQVGFDDISAPSISVSATGKASAVPDIATVDITVSKTASTAAQAQSNASGVMTAIVDAMKSLSIADADLKTTSFTTNEVYDYDVSPPVLSGYESTQTLTVKIRNTDNITSVIDAGPAHGATEVSSLQYSIDDESVLEQEARVEALASAKEQAVQIADAMNVRLGRVVSYSESTGGSYPYYEFSNSMAMLSDTKEAVIETGTQDIELTVYVTYSLF